MALTGGQGGWLPNAPLMIALRSGVGEMAQAPPMIAVIMKNCRAFRSHHDPGVMFAWI